MPVYQLVFVSNTISTIDIELKNTYLGILDHPDPDTFGLIDHYETMLGIGAAVLQTFLVGVHRGSREKLSLGPTHSGGKSYAQIINSCANYWKHHEEWNKSNLSVTARKTIESIKSVGFTFESSDYPLVDCMRCIFEGNSAIQYTNYLPYLEEWSNNVVK